MERLTTIGSILGFILSAASVFALIKTKMLSKLGAYVRKESRAEENKKTDEETGKRIDELNSTLQNYRRNEERDGRAA